MSIRIMMLEVLRYAGIVWVKSPSLFCTGVPNICWGVRGAFKPMMSSLDDSSDSSMPPFQA